MNAPQNDSDEIQSFINYISKGVDLETAGHACGLSLAEIYEWLERGKVEDERISGSSLKSKKAEAPFLALWRAVRLSRGKALAKAQMAVTQADDPKWQAWWLERTLPERFGKPSDRAALKALEGGMTNEHS